MIECPQNDMSAKLAQVTSIYAKDPKLKKEDVETLSQWAKSQPHLPQLEELQIVLFLHSCYYDVETAQITVEKYFTFRTTSELCRGLTEEIVRRTLSSFFISFMPKRTPDGDAVLVTKMLDTRPEAYHCLEQSKVVIALIILYLHQFGPPDGLIVVGDMKGTSMGHFFRMSLSVLKQTMVYVQEAAPIRIKMLHHVNALPITERFISVAKPFMKKELYDKLRFYSHSLDGLYDNVPKECLPEDYGGLLPSTEELKEKNLQNFLDNWDIVKWHEGQLVDESKRKKKERGFFGSLFYAS